MAENQCNIYVRVGGVRTVREGAGVKNIMVMDYSGSRQYYVKISG